MHGFVMHHGSSSPPAPEQPVLSDSYGWLPFKNFDIGTGVNTLTLTLVNNLLEQLELEQYFFDTSFTK